MRKIKFISILLVLSMLLTVPAFAFSTGFTDVSEKATYAESVSYLADAGILRGTASGRFAPNEKITVSQWATMLCRAFDTEPEGVSWQEVGANAVQIAIRSGWLKPTAISDANGLICRGELYRTAFSAAGIPLYDATLYGLDWLSSGENALRVGKELGLCAENKTAADLITRAEAAQLLHAVLTQTLTVVTPDTPNTASTCCQNAVSRSYFSNSARYLVLSNPSSVRMQRTTSSNEAVLLLQRTLMSATSIVLRLKVSSSRS